MKHFFIAFILLISLNACQDTEHESKIQAAHDAKIIAQERARVLSEFQAQKEKEALQAKEAAAKPQSTLMQLGIDIQENTIIIDGNKTKKFFNTLKDKMQTQIGKISHDVEENMLKSKEASMQIAKEHIDINKTKELLGTWNKKIQDFVQEFDAPATESNINKGN
jgi:phosphotransferase system HPr-like phosphotransfer protein